ncbi:MAG: MoaD/ThiS family protein [Inquilinus sp.]|nr:MoaD/ThiS family protein [Inquilinus sp.]
MVRVTLAGPLQAAAGGQSEFELEAATIRELLTRLGKDHPKLKPILDEGVTVAIDGELYRRAWFQPIPPDSEVYILPRMAGG